MGVGRVGARDFWRHRTVTLWPFSARSMAVSTPVSLPPMTTMFSGSWSSWPNTSMVVRTLSLSAPGMLALVNTGRWPRSHVVVLRRQHFPGGLGIELHVHTLLVALPDQEVLEVRQGPLEGGEVRVNELAAQLGFLLVEGDLGGPGPPGSWPHTCRQGRRPRQPRASPAPRAPPSGRSCPPGRSGG